MLSGTNTLQAPVRQVVAKVELLDGSTLLHTFKHTDKLISFSVDRVAENGGFFGRGVCQRLNLHLMDKDRELDITTEHRLNIIMDDNVRPFPEFRVARVNRDENTNELSITAYDAIYNTAAITISDLQLPQNYNQFFMLFYIAAQIGVPLNSSQDFFDPYTYAEGANLDGSETVRQVLDALAEASQSIYYINNQNELTFKRLDKEGAAAYTITKNDYFTLDSGTNRRLSAICHTTELGDSVEARLTITGTTQYIRDNPFWELREDIADVVNNALSTVGGLCINQFECEWRGNYLLEIGDKIALTTKDNNTVYSYVLDDVITYDGTLSEKTQWKYAETDNETAANPANLGEALKKTYARVDKVHQQIDLVASETDENISQLQITTNSIQASVNKLETNTNAAIGAVNGDVAALTQRVDASITADDVKIEIQKELDNGINKVKTNTGFTFNDEGLTVSKSGSEMTTQITEDGMKVYRDNTAVLTADNTGVVATNLHANTYLWIGKYSRFEDYEPEIRTGCFWVWDGE